MAKNLQMRRQAAGTGVGALGPDDLKGLVRDGLVAMNLTEREEFFQALEKEMKLIGLDIRKYLVPLGIPGRSPDDLTPTEVGHLVRFMKINVPNSTPAIEKAISRFSIFAEKSGSRLAA
ncbi:MAG TPA: hypothetical protein VJX67_08460 [Blastocatellia bacterium]|nr:hypothetical protein [Blastocatellia bacterium]